MDSADPLEIFWDNILSREPVRIQAAYKRLDPQAQAQVLQHLKRMVHEPGWHPEQVLSAQAALHALAAPGDSATGSAPGLE